MKQETLHHGAFLVSFDQIQLIHQLLNNQDCAYTAAKTGVKASNFIFPNSVGLFFI